MTNNSDEPIDLESESVTQIGTVEEIDDIQENQLNFKPFSENEQNKAREVTEVNQVELAIHKDKKSFDTLKDYELEGFDMLHKYLEEVSFPTLTEKEDFSMKQMLWEERSAFSKDSEDIGSVDDLQLNIKTVDDEPVVKNYNAIPKPLQEKVKNHVEGMLQRGWIQK